MSEGEPDPHLRRATMAESLRMFAQLPLMLWEWARLIHDYPEHQEALDVAYAELDDATSPLSPLSIVRILRARMDASVRDPFTGRLVPGPHHPTPGER